MNELEELKKELLVYKRSEVCSNVSWLACSILITFLWAFAGCIIPAIVMATTSALWTFFLIKSLEKLHE